MGKSSRKNKEKKKDFQKVKLKVGKTKAKADNFTDTSFKSRGIQIREQLKSVDRTDEEPLTQKKRNIQELLCQVNHYNSSIRCSAIQGIRSLITARPTLAHMNLPTLLPALGNLLTDKESSVRQAVSALLGTIIESLTTNQMAPFFSTLCLHLCCAMTHIQEDIQLDSLVVMETILQNFPGLVTPHSRELLTNFIQLISQQRGKLGASSSLKVNPSGKLAGQKWRLKVLQMLKRFMEVVKETKAQENDHQDEELTTTIRVTAGDGRPTHAPILKGNGIYCKQKSLILRNDQSASNVSTDLVSDPEALLSVCHTLVPLLLQCWGEVNLPSQGTRGEGVTIGEREGGTLRCVLAILHAVWTLMEAACAEKGNRSALLELRKSYHRKITQHFQQGFPYSFHQHPVSKARKGASSKASGASGGSGSGAISVNLAACDLVLTALVEEGSSRCKPHPWRRVAMEFVNDMLREEAEEGAHQMDKWEQEVLMDVTMKMMTDASDDDAASLEDSLFSYYNTSHPLSQQKLRALRALRAHLLEKATPGNQTLSPKMAPFLQSLGHVVSEARSSPVAISHDALHTLLVAASRGYTEATECIQAHISDWLGNDIMKSLDKPTQRRLLTCLYYMPTFDPSLVEKLTAYCCQLTTEVQFPLYLIANRCFGNVLEGSRKPPLRPADFIQLLLSVSMGSTDAKLASLQRNAPTEQTSQSVGSLGTVIKPFYHIIYDESRDVEMIDRAAAVNKIALQIYKKHPNPESLRSLVLGRISETLKSCCFLPIRAVLSILEHLAIFNDARSCASRNETATSSQTSSSISSSTTLPKTSEHLQQMLGNLSFVLLYETTAKSSFSVVERGEEEYFRRLSSLLCEKCLASCGDGVIGALLDCALTTARGCQEDRLTGKSVVNLLQRGSLKRRLHGHVHKLQLLVAVIESQLATPTDCRWFAELKYEVSLLGKEAKSRQFDT